MKDKRVLIVGGTGSLGKTLIGRLKDNNTVGIFSRDEAKHWTIKNNLGSNSKVDFFVGDIRDYDRLESVFFQFNPEIIIVAAALKQVDTCELSPDESIKTNIDGPKNIVEIIKKNAGRLSCNTVLMVSTDKACEPVNVYGMCKSISERIVTSQSALFSNTSIRFIGTRYGNVLDSRGSIIPLFKYQSLNNESITITDNNMTRFVMTLDESVDLILEAIKNCKSGEILIPKLKSMKIRDLAEIYSEISNKPITVMGIRPGEKIHEKLVCEAESLRARDIKTHYVLDSSISSLRKDSSSIFEYSSDCDVLEKEELRRYLSRLGHLDLSLENYPGNKIEEIDVREKTGRE